jgi:ABC-type nitrate/sulfonate/bicarbonate transport system permease component
MSATAPSLPHRTAPARGTNALHTLRRASSLLGLGWIVPFALLCFWEFAAASEWVAPHLLPPPSALAHRANRHDPGVPPDAKTTIQRPVIESVGPA